MEDSYLTARDKQALANAGTPKWMIFLPEIVLTPIALVVWLFRHPVWFAPAFIAAIVILALVPRRWAAR